jgi:hypothetical protein
MRETSKHATALALHSQRLGRLQDSFESGTTAVIGHIEDLSRIRPASGSWAHLELTSTRDKGLESLECGVSKRTKAHTFHLRLPSWLMDCVWEFGVHTSTNVWTVQVYTTNIRPARSCVFDVLYSGNVQAVRELLESGQLSLRDRAQELYGPDRTLLMASRSKLQPFLPVS